MASALTTAARRSLLSRALPHAREFATGIPIGARAQVLVSAVAPHRPGASKDVAEVLFEQGASSTLKALKEETHCRRDMCCIAHENISRRRLFFALRSRGHEKGHGGGHVCHADLGVHTLGAR